MGLSVVNISIVKPMHKVSSSNVTEVKSMNIVKVTQYPVHPIISVLDDIVFFVPWPQTLATFAWMQSV